MLSKRVPYNYPPRGMDRVEAARYIGVGITKFDEMVADRRMPKPKRIDSRNVWGRIHLDAAFTDLPEREDNENRIDAAMVRARRDRS